MKSWNEMKDWEKAHFYVLPTGLGMSLGCLMSLPVSFMINPVIGGGISIIIGIVGIIIMHIGWGMLKND